MATIIPPFDPTASASGQFNVSLVNGGWLFIHNESPAILQVTVSIQQGAFLVSAYTVRCVRVQIASDMVSWQQLGQVLSATINAPVSSVYVEAYAPNEWLGGEGYWPLSRQLNQPRIISLPMPGPQWFHGSATLGVNINDKVDAGMTAIALSAANLTNGKANLYIYDFVAEPQTVGMCYASFSAQFCDNTHTPLGTPFKLFNCTLSRAGVFGPVDSYRMPHTVPYAYEAGSLPGGSFEIKFFWTLFDGFGGMRVNTRIHAGLDLTNASGGADYGNWPLHTGGGPLF